MLITPAVIYSLIASFALRIYYNNRLMLASQEWREAHRAAIRRRLVLAGLLVCAVFLDSDLGLYKTWWSAEASWWKLTLGIFGVGILWLLKESTYKTQVLWHHYDPPAGQTKADMHRPALTTSLVFNTIFWVFFLTFPGLPFYTCVVKPLLHLR